MLYCIKIAQSGLRLSLRMSEAQDGHKGDYEAKKILCTLRYFGDYVVLRLRGSACFLFS